MNGWRKFKNGNKKAIRWSIVAPDLVLNQERLHRNSPRSCACVFESVFFSFLISCLHLPFVFFPRRICFAKASKSNPVTLTTFGQPVANPPMMWQKCHIRGPRQQHRRHQRIWSIGINFHQCLKGPAPRFQTQALGGYWKVGSLFKLKGEKVGGRRLVDFTFVCVYIFCGGGEGVGNLKTKTCEVRLS